jgi:hypothetical protein
MRSRNESEDLEAAEIILALTSMRSHSKVQEERHFMLDDQLEVHKGSAFQPVDHNSNNNSAPPPSSFFTSDDSTDSDATWTDTPSPTVVVMHPSANPCVIPSRRQANRPKNYKCGLCGKSWSC